MTTIEKLKRMRKLLARDGGWVQGSNAMDANGNDVPIDDPRAVSHCLVGAVTRVSLVDTGGLAVCLSLCRAIGNRPGCETVLSKLFIWNDTCERTQAEVVALVDKAIAGLTT